MLSNMPYLHNGEGFQIQLNRHFGKIQIFLENSSQYQKKSISLNWNKQCNYKQTSMNKQTPTVIGIDIGSFTAKIGAVINGAISIITNEANFRETPLVVAYGDGERKIGQIGQVKLKSNFKNSIISPLRYLGLNQKNSKDQLKYNPCPTVWENQKLYFKVQIDGQVHQFNAEQVMAAFFTQIDSILSLNNLEAKMVVLSVPAFFTHNQNTALLNAAEISGLRNVKLVSDTVAAGLNYGSFKKSELESGKNIVFLDFGHSKLTASLIQFSGNTMQVMKQKFNRNLGCRNIDQQIFDHIANIMLTKTSLDINQNKKACLKLMDVISRQRKILSGISETDISIECLLEDNDLCEQLTRSEMVAICNEIFDQIKQLLTEFKSELDQENIKIDSVQLIGGGSRIPKFVEIAEAIFQTIPSRTMNSSEAIAEGATLAAVQFSNIFRLHSFKIKNKSSHQISLSWEKSPTQTQNQEEMKQENREDKDNKAEGESIKDESIRKMEILICEGEEIPVEKHVKITTEDPIRIMISYEGLQDWLETTILTAYLDKPKDGQLNLKFEVTEDGMVILRAAKDKQGQTVKFICNTKMLSAQEITKYKTVQRELFVRDFNIVRLYEKKNSVEAFIYKQEHLLEDQLLSRYLSQAQKQDFEETLRNIKTSLEDSENLTIADLENKVTEIQKAADKLREASNKAKQEVMMQLKKLDDLKIHASEAFKQISQRYRHTAAVVEVLNEIQKIHNWAEEAIRSTRLKSMDEPPVASQEDINQQFQNIKVLSDKLIPPQPQNYYPSQTTRSRQQPRRRAEPMFEDPFWMSRSSFFPSGHRSFF